MDPLPRALTGSRIVAVLGAATRHASALLLSAR